MNDLTPIQETAAPVNIATPLPDGQTVTQVKHWTEKLFSFRLTRPQSLRFRSGEFVMIGLMGDPDPQLWEIFRNENVPIDETDLPGLQTEFLLEFDKSEAFVSSLHEAKEEL